MKTNKTVTRSDSLKRKVLIIFKKLFSEASFVMSTGNFFPSEGARCSIEGANTK